MSRYQKSKTSLDFTEVRDSEWQWNPLGHMQVCTSLQTDNHASTPPLSFLQAGCPSCRPTNSVKALKAQSADSALMLIVCLPVVSVSLSVHMASSCQPVALLQSVLIHSVIANLLFKFHLLENIFCGLFFSLHTIFNQ